MFLKDAIYAALALLLVSLWIASGVYISFAHTDTSSLSNKYKDDTNLATASKWSLIAEFITWTLVVLGAIVVLLLIALAILGSEILPELLAVVPGKSKVVGILLIVTVVALILLLSVTGMCGVVASINVHTSANYDADDKKFSDGYKNATIAASLAFGSVGLLVIGFVALEISKYTKRKKAAAARPVVGAGEGMLEELVEEAASVL